MCVDRRQIGWRASVGRGLARPGVLFLVGLLAGCAGSFEETPDPPDRLLRQVLRDASSRDDDARTRCALAVAFTREGLLGSADRELRRAADMDPRLPAVWFLTAEVAEHRGRIQQSEEAWARYFALRPQARSIRAVSESSVVATSEWQEVRRRELESVLQPRLEASRQLLLSLVLRSSPPGEPGDAWDPSITDGVSWELGAGGLPDFPPPPGRP